MTPRFFHSQRALKARVADFWKWFLKNEPRIFEFDKDREPVFDDLSKALQRVQENLCFEFSSPENGIREFTISAGGIKRAFPAVIELVNCAPPLPRFKLLAFRQRHQFSFVKFGPYKFDPSEVLVYVEPDGLKFQVSVLMKGVASASQQMQFQMKTAMYLLLDSVLGEYDVETKLSGIELVDLDQNRDLDSIPLEKLAQIVDGRLQLN